MCRRSGRSKIIVSPQERTTQDVVVDVTDLHSGADISSHLVLASAC
jgi:hypothetical protein